MRNSKYINEYILIGIGLVLLLVVQLLGFNGLYGQDSYEYTRYSGSWIRYFSEGIHPGDYHWPLNYPVNGAILGFVLGIKAATILQLLSLFAFIGNAILLFKLIRIFYPTIQKYSTHWVVIGFILAPYVTRTGLVAMSDQYASFLSLAACYAAIMVVKKGKHWWLIGMLLFGAMAVMTRYICALMMVPIGLYVLPYLWRQRLWLPAVASVVVATIPFLPHYFIRMQNVGGFVDHPALSKWSVGNMFSRTFESDLGHFEFLVPNIIYVFQPFFHPGFLFFGIVLVFFYRKLQWTKEVLLLISILAIFLVFTAGVDTQNNRYFITVFPFIPLLIYPLFFGLAEWVSHRKKQLVLPFIATLIIAQLGLAGYAFSKFYQINKTEKEVAALFDDVKGKMVYTYGTEMALSHYNKNNTFKSLHLQDGLNPDPGIYFLFDHNWLKNEQVKELFQVKLWEQLRDADRLKSVKKLKNWELYEVR
jgi:4-amino-4-deoxy-L-arabinose transferase-like glycosyltransferase